MKHKPSDVEWKDDGGPLYKYSNYWLYRFEMYEACDFHGHYWDYDDWVNEQPGFLDHRITKAISLTSKKKKHEDTK